MYILQQRLTETVLATPRVVLIKTFFVVKYPCSYPVQIHDSNHTHS